jgi:hypothetical protein
MIKITIELWPLGFEKDKEILGVMEIWNNASGTRTRGNYGFKILEKGRTSVWKSGDVLRFPRKRLGSWDLLYRCLKQVLYERNMS